MSSLCGPAALLWPILMAAQAQPQSTPQITAILERLDRLERENKALTEQVKALRARIDGSAADPAPQSSAAAPEPERAQSAAAATLPQQVEVHGRRIQELEQTKVEASQKFPIQLTGMALFNAFYNSKESAGSEYPVVASAPGPRSAGATIRQTVLGLEFGAPSTVWGGRIRGSVYMDFFSGGGLSQTMRLRTGSVEIDWKHTSILAGLEKPIFNPRDPSSLAQVGVAPLTGTGNLWLWLPQVRFEQDIPFTDATGLRAQVGVVQTREVGPYAGSAPVGNVEAARPGVEGRFEFFHNFDDQRKLEIAPGFHASQTHVAGMSVPSRVFSMDWFFNPWTRLEFSGAFYKGQNVASLGSGYQQGFGFYPGGFADAVASRGGWAQLTIHTLPRVDLHLFSGQQDDDNGDLVAGRIGKNLMFGGNVYYRLAPNVLLAFEATRLRTAYIGQAVRFNNHYDLALAYLF